MGAGALCNSRTAMIVPGTDLAAPDFDAPPDFGSSFLLDRGTVEDEGLKVEVRAPPLAYNSDLACVARAAVLCVRAEAGGKEVPWLGLGSRSWPKPTSVLVLAPTW